MTYCEFKKDIWDIMLPYWDEYTGKEIKQIKPLILQYTNLAIDDIQREVWPLEKSIKLDGVSCALPDNLIKFLGAEPNEPYKLTHDEDGGRRILFKKAGCHRIRFVYDGGPATGDTYEFPFPEQVMGAVRYFVLYHLLALENDTRQYAAYYNLYNQACGNILANREKRCAFVGGMRGV